MPQRRGWENGPGEAGALCWCGKAQVGAPGLRSSRPTHRLRSLLTAGVHANFSTTIPPTSWQADLPPHHPSSACSDGTLKLNAAASTEGTGGREGGEGRPRAPVLSGELRLPGTCGVGATQPHLLLLPPPYAQTASLELAQAQPGFPRAWGKPHHTTPGRFVESGSTGPGSEGQDWGETPKFMRYFSVYFCFEGQLSVTLTCYFCHILAPKNV